MNPGPCARLPRGPSGVRCLPVLLAFLTYYSSLLHGPDHLPAAPGPPALSPTPPAHTTPSARSPSGRPGSPLLQGWTGPPWRVWTTFWSSLSGGGTLRRAGRTSVAANAADLIPTYDTRSNASRHTGNRRPREDDPVSDKGEAFPYSPDQAVPDTAPWDEEQEEIFQRSKRSSGLWRHGLGLHDDNGPLHNHQAHASRSKRKEKGLRSEVPELEEMLPLMEPAVQGYGDNEPLDLVSPGRSGPDVAESLYSSRRLKASSTHNEVLEEDVAYDQPLALLLGEDVVLGTGPEHVHAGHLPRGDGDSSDESRSNVLKQLLGLQRLLSDTPDDASHSSSLLTSSRFSDRYSQPEEKYVSSEAFPASPAEEFSRDSRGRTCQLSAQHRVLAESLNSMETLEAEYLSRTAYYSALYSRHGHNLTGMCSHFPVLASGLGSQANDLSLCPWRLERNYNDKRFPRTLWFAQCVCGHCSGVSGGGGVSLYSCMPLYHRINVINEVCEAGNASLLWGHEDVPVGCFCAHPTVRVG